MKATGLMLRCFMEKEQILEKQKNYVLVKWQPDEDNQTFVHINGKCFGGNEEDMRFINVFKMKVGDTISLSIPSGTWSGRITGIQKAKARNSIVEFWVKEVEWEGAFRGLDTGASGFCSWEVANWYAPNPTVETSLYPDPIPFDLYKFSRVVASYSREPKKALEEILNIIGQSKGY